MRQAFWILSLAGAVAVAAPQGSLKAASGPKDAIAQARDLIASKDLKKASSVLVDNLGAAQGEDRRAILDLLKQTYKSLISEAHAAGDVEGAELYADDLAILDAQPAPAPPPPPAAEGPAKPSFEPTPVPEPARAPAMPEILPGPAGKPETQASASVVLPRNDQPPDPRSFDEPDRLPAPDALPALDAPLARPRGTEPPEKPSSPPVTTKAPPARGTADAPPTRSSRPAARDDAVRTASNPAERVSDGDTTRASASNDLAAADALFGQKKYDQAGSIYAALAARNQLPSARKKVWAYCRWAAVVARINARPRSAKEWDEIEREIQSVEVLTPGNWYGEYLKDRVSAARRGERPAGRQGRLVVRGAAPEEPEEAPEPRNSAGPASAEEVLELPSSTAPTSPSPAPAPAAARAPAVQRAPISTAQAPKWQLHETSSFRIYHTDPALAEQAAEVAEAVRARQGTRWGSKVVQTPWTPRCDIYLYPTAQELARMTGQPETSPGFSTMGVSGSQVVARRVNLRADHPQVLAAILPHEVTHVVLADVFNDQQIPRWADEGMAVLAEPSSEQAGRAADLHAPLADQRVFKISQLMTIDYPDSKDWNLFYAQSVSLTQFLVRQGTAAQFVTFVKNAQRQGPEAALREVYRFKSLDDLEARWRDYAVQQASQLAKVETTAEHQ